MDSGVPLTVVTKRKAPCDFGPQRNPGERNKTASAESQAAAALVAARHHPGLGWGRRRGHPCSAVTAARLQPCSHTGAGGHGCHHLRRLFWPVVARPVGEWVQRGLLAFGYQWRKGGWCMPTLFLTPCPYVVVAQVPVGMANGCGSMLSGSVRLLRLSTLCSAG
jgi:hypothetical protein